MERYRAWILMVRISAVIAAVFVAVLALVAILLARCS
jgi:hypothetical protein